MSKVWIGLLVCVCVCLRVTAQPSLTTFLLDNGDDDDDQTGKEVRFRLQVMGLLNSGRCVCVCVS